VAKTEAVRDRAAARTRERRDRAEAGAAFRLNERYALRGDAEWQADYALDEAGWKLTGGTRARHSGAYSLGADLRPVPSVQLLLAHDREETRDDLARAVERASEANRVEGYWFATPDLEFHAVAGLEDLRDARKIGVAQGLLHRYERRWEADVTYNWSTRLSCFGGVQWRLRRVLDPGRSDTELTRLRGGLNLHLHPDWELTARIRHDRLDGESMAATESDLATGEALENHRWIATGEVAYDLARMWRLALGYETLEHAIDSQEDSPDDFAADRVYLKLMQKF
jgi:hypothetical protein